MATTAVALAAISGAWQPWLAVLARQGMVVFSAAMVGFEPETDGK
jgi:hypothetical protein